MDVTDRTALEPAFRRAEAELGPSDFVTGETIRVDGGYAIR